MSSSSSITVKGCYTVTPMEPTWNGYLPLTEFDQIDITSYAPLLFYYRPPRNWLTPPTKIAATLKESLSRVLIHFYPFAGRLRSTDNNRFELECNAKGVQFIEAAESTSSALSDLGDFSCSNNYCSYLFPQVDYTLPIPDRPLLIVQLTHFKCGDISISLLLSHVITDGQSATHFIDEWARVARGESLKRVPFLDRNILRNKEPCNGVNEWKFAKPPLLLENSESNLDERKKKTTVAIIQLSKAQIERLRKISNESWNKSSNERSYTIYETITGHIWRSACKARGLKIDQPTVFGIVVNFKSRVKPSLPKTYFGNAIVNVVATSLAGDLMSKPLGYASSRIKEAIEKVNDEYVRLTLTEYIKKDYDRTKIRYDTVPPFYRNPNLGAVSLMMFSFANFDFGWGKELYVIPGIHIIREGETFILPSSQVDGSLVLLICLQEIYMNAFKRHFNEGVVELDSLSKL
ncbi:spermidine hydroxycinnamoyl transferase-like [Vicia villosa]|uniref:spermidine hydroxycinnamoyl transferase-like n=1 Tax=Vicia villosa TaxID=3911 RepID=UPI00273C92CF|nr:spermidine hydroxycinnamoyl transferase-like [Vicia villosa]